MRILERTRGRYETQDVEAFGKVYRWCSERIMVECDCGERVTLTASSNYLRVRHGPRSGGPRGVGCTPADKGGGRSSLAFLALLRRRRDTLLR